MDLDFSAEQRAFRDEVRAFIRERLPAEIRQRLERRSASLREGSRYWGSRRNRAWLQERHYPPDNHPTPTNSH